jgi:hypothetical protein
VTDTGYIGLTMPGDYDTHGIAYDYVTRDLLAAKPVMYMDLGTLAYYAAHPGDSCICPEGTVPGDVVRFLFSDAMVVYRITEVEDGPEDTRGYHRQVTLAWPD